MTKYNLLYACFHAVTGMIVVYVTTKSLAFASIYVVFDALIHGIVVHHIAHVLAEKVSRGKFHATIESIIFFPMHLVAAILLAWVVVGDIKQAIAIGVTEPIAQGIVKFFYTTVWNYRHNNL